MYLPFQHQKNPTSSGLADPNALVESIACLQGCQHIGTPECDVLLAQCAVRLARAPKSTEVYHAMERCKRSLAKAKGPLPAVPLHLRNAPTKLMKQIGKCVIIIHIFHLFILMYLVVNPLYASL